MGGGGGGGGGREKEREDPNILLQYSQYLVIFVYQIKRKRSY